MKRNIKNLTTLLLAVLTLTLALTACGKSAAEEFASLSAEHSKLLQNLDTIYDACETAMATEKAYRAAIDNYAGKDTPLDTILSNSDAFAAELKEVLYNLKVDAKVYIYCNDKLDTCVYAWGTPDINGNSFQISHHVNYSDVLHKHLIVGSSNINK